MKKIPTVKEFMQGKAFSIPSIENMIIEFAKLHVEAALKAASKGVKQFPVRVNEMGFCEDSILNSYPLDNIK